MSGWRLRSVDRETSSCTHGDEYPSPAAPAQECEDCVAEGTTWVHLRRCLECGHVGCCNDSPRKHATAHFNASTHPVMASAEEGEHWAWCFVDDVLLVPRVDA
jgi:monovalent cation/hydrogen antiporter